MSTPVNRRSFFSSMLAGMAALVSARVATATPTPEPLAKKGQTREDVFRLVSDEVRTWDRLNAGPIGSGPRRARLVALGAEELTALGFTPAKMPPKIMLAAKDMSFNLTVQPMWKFPSIVRVY